MRVIIAGSRRFTDYVYAKRFITQSLAQLPNSQSVTILSRGCPGADRLGENYASEHHLAVERFLPQWKVYGKRAGPLRNRAMVETCDAVICFWDGESRGTRSLLRYAAQQQKVVFTAIVSVDKDT